MQVLNLQAKSAKRKEVAPLGWSTVSGICNINTN